MADFDTDDTYTDRRGEYRKLKEQGPSFVARTIKWLTEIDAVIAGETDQANIDKATAMRAQFVAQINAAIGN